MTKKAISIFDDSLYQHVKHQFIPLIPSSDRANFEVL